MSICGCASGSPSGSVYALVCNVRLLGRFAGRDTRCLVICGGEELRPDDCAPWELANSASNVRVLWELPDSVRRVPDPDPLVTILQIGSYSGLDSSPYGIPSGNHIEDRPVYLVYYRWT